jgi:hypothetical protein
MFNTSFSNKTQLKIKNIFILFYFTGSDPVQCIFSFGPDPVQPAREQWSMPPLFSDFSARKKQQNTACGKPAAQP